MVVASYPFVAPKQDSLNLTQELLDGDLDIVPKTINQSLSGIIAAEAIAVLFVRPGFVGVL